MSVAPDPLPAVSVDPMGPGARRILVVDADDRTRESVAGILSIRHRFEVVGTAGHVGEALRLAREGRPEVVIVDPRMPEITDGIALIRRLRAIDPDVAILVVGWSPELQDTVLDAGADGFVRKTFKPGDLAAAIGRCCAVRAREAAGDAAGDPAAADPDGTLESPVTPSPEPPAAPVPTRGSGLVL